MKLQRKISTSTIVEAEAPTMVELFEVIPALEEVFRPPP